MNFITVKIYIFYDDPKAGKRSDYTTDITHS